MTFRKFDIFLVMHIGAILISIYLLLRVLELNNLYATKLFLVVLVLFQLCWLYRFLGSANRHMMRFLSAVQHTDFSRRFDFVSVGLGLDDITQKFNDILKQLQTQRQEQESQYWHLRALIEHSPTPLISIHLDGKPTLWNKAARQLFEHESPSVTGVQGELNDPLWAQIKLIQPGERVLVELPDGQTGRKLTAAATRIISHHGPEKLVSLQSIDTELRLNESQAWHDMARVLTHEIMNSLTPVTSLAMTSVDLIDDLAKMPAFPQTFQAEIANIRHAVERVASRSDGLMNFVSGYRRFTKLPTPNKTVFDLQDVVNAVITLSANNWLEKGIALDVRIVPGNLAVKADRSLIEQAFMNVIQNAEQALEGRASAHLTISAAINRRGRVVVEFTDNGPGVEDSITKEIFVPFYTTRREGSGIGLALTRQIMIAHGGDILFEHNNPTGAKFIVIF